MVYWGLRSQDAAYLFSAELWLRIVDLNEFQHPQPGNLIHFKLAHDSATVKDVHKGVHDYTFLHTDVWLGDEVRWVNRPVPLLTAAAESAEQFVAGLKL